MPDSVWVSPNVDRVETCCGDPGTGNWTFVSFTATLDPNVAEVAVGLAPSDPGGASSGYWVDVCGTWSDRIEGGTEVCITGPGTHNFWYGKSGGNANSAYTIVQIPKPTFPADDSVRIGCSLPLDIYGLNGITMTSGNPIYDSWLDMTDPSHPIFTPGTTAPVSIDFTITGTQIASASCGAYATTDVVTIYIYQPLDVTISPDPSTFCEGGNVTLTANVPNGVGTVSYSWIDNSTNLEISTTASTPPISVAGNYTVYVSDILNRYGCAPVGVTQSVSETLAPDIFAGEDDTVCSTSPSALLVATLDNPGTGVLWTSPTGGTFSDATSLAPIYTASAADLINGSVDLTVTAFGCQNASDIVTIVFDAGPVYNVNTPALLCSESTGLVSVNVTSGGLSPWAPISYYWSFSGVSGPSSATLGAGTYSVTVVNQYGCGSNTPFTLTAPPALTLVMSNTDATPTGTATGLVGGGTPGYTYSWENSAGTFMGNTATIVGLPTDFYVLTATDLNGCIISSSTVVNDPLCSGFNASATGTDATCFGGADGSASVTGTGGAGSVGPYAYNWLVSPIQTTITATGLSAGVYEVIVSDLLLGCRDVAIAVVGEPSQITNTMTHTDNIEIGGTIGTATANPAGGTSPYTYSWNTAPVQTTQTATGLAADLYTVTITDDNSCAINDEVLINEPPCDNFQAAVTVTNVSCNGDMDGSANVIAVHGTAPYTYSLDGSPYALNPGANFSGLAGGAHTLSIMDAQKCVVIQNFSVVEPSVLSIGLNATDMTCFAQPENGTIDLSVTGGTFPYAFEWINNDGNIQIATTEDIINLGVGTYSVTVTDSKGCEAQSSIGIDQPAKLGASYLITDITCFGADNGAIDVTVSGGQTPYDYNWVFSGGTSTSEDLSALSPGQYILTVTDGNNCSVSNIADVYMNEPAQVEIFSTLVYCPVPGDATTLVEVDSISGGTGGPYQLAFNGGPSLAAGVYTTSLAIDATHSVTAFDANGCTVIAPTSFTINPAVVISNVTFNPCIPAAATNIDITVTPTGGDAGPYQVSVDNGITYAASGTYTLSVPVGANYEVVISDGLLCESLPFSIVVPNEIATSFVVDSVACLNGTDGSILFSASGGTAPYNISWTGPVNGNPAGNEITSSGGTYTISSLSAGNYSVTVTDFNGCTKVTSVSVGTTVDLLDPSISCPGTISTNSDLNNCFAVVTYGTPVGTDNCPGSITTQTAGLASGSNFPVGTTTNSFLVTDAQGRTATCSFDITVIDAQLPTITCPANVAVNNDAGDCFADATSVLLGAPVTADNCGVNPATNNAPATYPVGTTTVVWTVIDIHGNSNTCNQLVVVTDNEDPTITCPADVAVDSDAGECYATSVSLGVPTTNDNCGVATTTNNAPSIFPVGTTTVTWTVTDIHGNVITCDQDVVVTDNEDPTITCPADVAVDSDAGLCEATTVSLGTPNTNDNCGIATITNNAPATYPVGTTTVTWTVTDIHGNTITCDQDVVVTDNENPTITCPADVAVDSDAGLCEATTVALGTPTTNDNCGVATITNNAPATYPVGTTTVTWTVTDVHGNTFTCDQDVVVTDNEDPTIICPADVAVDNDAGECYATSVSLGTPTTNDNCGVATITNNAPSVFFVGTTTVTWTVTDIHGNTITCDQDVVVTDSENPTITCPADVAVNSDAGLCEATTVSLGTPNTSDNCGVATVTNNAPATYPVGTTTVTWTVTDIHGNIVTCDQDVVVTDNENPTIVCPADVAVDSDAGLCEATTVALGTPTTNDNCGVATVTNDAPSTYLVGTTIVTWTVTDVNGNFVTCTQNVVVTDNEDPTITCPADVAVNNDPGLCSASSVSLGTPTTNDNCGVATVTNNAPSVFAVGTTIVTWTVTDIHGNSITCDQNVLVTDNELPVTTDCPADINTCFPLVTYAAPTANDNCGVSTIVMTAGLGSGATFPIGTTTEEYTITDIHGNVTVCSFDVTIYPTPVASFVATDVTCYNAADGTIDITVTDGTAPYLFTWSNNETSEDVANLVPGTYSVLVTDLNGCETTSATVISQPDTIAISETHTNVSCYNLEDGSVTITVEGGTTPYNFDWSNGSTNQDQTLLAAGIYDLTLTDNNGCIYQLSVEITQPDTLAASATTLDATCLSADGTLDMTVEGGTLPYSYLWSNSATTQDLNDVVSGTYVVMITDANGCQFEFTDSILSTNPIGINANVQDALCYGDRNGLIDITVTNAVEPISYLWSTGDTSAVIINAIAGDYTVTVTDSNQCTLTVTYTIEQPDSLYIELYSPVFTGDYNVSSYLGTDGSIETTVTGGTSPYEFLWSDASTTQDLFNLPAGNYAVLVTDENGCTVQASIILTSPWELEMPTGYSPNGDGQNDFFVVHGIEVFPDNEITVYNRWGNVVYSATGYQNEWNGFNTSGEELPDGTYFVVLKVAGLDEPLTGYVDLRRKH